MSNSLINNTKVCYFCGRQNNLHKHHIFGGVGRRSLSEEYGAWVYLCPEHHTGPKGVHFDKARDQFLKRECQRAWEETRTRDEFREVFGKSYL